MCQGTECNDCNFLVEGEVQTSGVLRGSALCHSTATREHASAGPRTTHMATSCVSPARPRAADAHLGARGVEGWQSCQAGRTSASPDV